MAYSPFANLKSGKDEKPYVMIDNYIYFHHLDEFIIIPSYPESVIDNTQVSFASSTILTRSAPIYSYSSSGPRSVNFTLKLHRELMQQINYKKSNATVQMGDDYVDTIINYVQAAALPRYSASEKMVDPPIISLRLGDDIFIKGVVSNNVQISYSLPIITDINGKDRYAMVEINFSINEIDPYDAETVLVAGSFRGLDTSLERNLWKQGGSLSSGITGGGGRNTNTVS